MTGATVGRVQTTRSPDSDRLAPVDEPQFDLVVKPEDVTHLVCCRDVSWKKALCGFDGDAVNIAATVICTMCFEWAESREPGFSLAEPIICPIDGRPCPDEGEIDQRIARETRPTS